MLDTYNFCYSLWENRQEHLSSSANAVSKSYEVLCNFRRKEPNMLALQRLQSPLQNLPYCLVSEFDGEHNTGKPATGRGGVAVS